MNQKKFKKNSAVISSLFFINLVTFFSVNLTYAADTIPSPVGTVNLYGFIILVIDLIMNWFIFPVIVFAWFYAGFLFVKAQGNPGELKEARGWLWWTLIGTVIILLAKGFAIALSGTITKIFS